MQESKHRSTSPTSVGDVAPGAGCGGFPSSGCRQTSLSCACLMGLGQRWTALRSHWPSRWKLCEKASYRNRQDERSCNMRLKDVMKKPVAVVAPDTPLREAARKMNVNG